jgi:hypothetical protein
MADADKIRAAQNTILDKIIDWVGLVNDGGTGALHVLQLAEAYAWVSHPRQHHGGHGES